MERFVNHSAGKSNHFPAKKMLMMGVSGRENRVVTKIFIN
jgi:hypothetical protein